MGEGAGEEGSAEEGTPVAGGMTDGDGGGGFRDGQRLGR
jgi:hypothetical protein